MKTLVWKGRNDRQELIDSYRLCGGDSILHFDHKKKLIEIEVKDGSGNGLIFGTLAETLCELAEGTKTCVFKDMLDKVKSLES